MNRRHNIAPALILLAQVIVITLAAEHKSMILSKAIAKNEYL
ncbi:MAG: hypothetical protein AAFO76_06340 [Cyanobacteria bacterium J06607_15]